MRSLWKGAISFGLVHIPVKLYTATESRDVRFHMLHRACHTPIRYRKFCPACGREVEAEEIARGYEYAGGRYVLVEDEDLDALPLRTDRAVEILDFVRLDEIDPVFFEKTYFLEPAEGGAKAYALLRHAMERTGRAAVAKVALRSKESLAAIRLYNGLPAGAANGSAAGAANGPAAGVGARGGGGLSGGVPILVLETMFFPDEIRSYAQLAEAYRPVAVNERELAMAVHLIESLSVSFQPEKYRDEYREALLEVIEDKVAGREVVTPEAPEPARVVDLMRALEESIRMAEERRRGGPPAFTGAAVNGAPGLGGVTAP